MQGLTEGRIVHFVLRNETHRPAIIVDAGDRVSGMVNLQVFTDGANDEWALGHTGNIDHQTSVPYSEEKTPFTWHWIEPA